MQGQHVLETFSSPDSFEPTALLGDERSMTEPGFCCAALQASTIAIIALGGRMPQILLNARRGNSGELSPLTSILNLAGNVARLFTTAVLTKVATGK